MLELDQSRDLREIANLGLTLPEAKQLLARVQQAVVAVQARDHAALRPECSRCGASCQVKDWQSRQVATLFGTVAVRLPRFRCPGCGRNEAGITWPVHCRSTPELDQLQAHLSALMTDRVAVGVLAHLRPVAAGTTAGTSHETLRGRTLKLGEQLRRAAAVAPEPVAMAPAAPTSAISLSLDSTYVRSCHAGELTAFTDGCSGLRHLGRRRCYGPAHRGLVPCCHAPAARKACGGRFARRGSQSAAGES